MVEGKGADGEGSGDGVPSGGSSVQLVDVVSAKCQVEVGRRREVRIYSACGAGKQEEGGSASRHWTTRNEAGKDKAKHVNALATADEPMSVSSTHGADEGAELAKYRTKTSTYTLKRVVDSLSKEQKETVAEIGLGSLLGHTSFTIDGEFLHWLVTHFNCESCSLDVHGVSVSVTPGDVERVIGLRNKGRDINGCAAECYVDPDMEAQLDIAVKEGEIHIGQLCRNLKGLRSSGVEFAVKFVLIALGTVLCLGPNWGEKRRLLPFLYWCDDLGDVNWAKYILDELVQSIRQAKRRCMSEVGGCVIFLMLMYLENFNLAGEKYDEFESRALPRLLYWDEDAIIRRLCALKASGVLVGVEVPVVVHRTPRFSCTSAYSAYLHPKLESRMAELEARNLDLQQTVTEIQRTVESLGDCIHVIKGAIVNGIVTNRPTAGRGKSRHGLIDEDEEPSSAVETRQGRLVFDGKTLHSKTACIPMFLGAGGPLLRSTPVVPNLPCKSSHGPSRQELEEGAEDVTSPSLCRPRSMQAEAKQQRSNNNAPTKERCAITYSRRRLFMPTREDVSSSGTPERGTMVRGSKRQGHSASRKHSSCPKSYGQSKKMRASCKSLSAPNTGDIVSERALAPSCFTDKPCTVPGPKLMACDRLQVHIFTALANFVFDPQLPQNETLVRILSQATSRAQLQCFSPQTWLNSEVISCFAGMLTQRRRKHSSAEHRDVWFLPTIMQQLILTGKLTFQNVYTEYLTNGSFGGPLSECRKICIPMNYRNEHWFMVVIDLLLGKVFILDSKPDDTQNQGREANTLFVVKILHKALGYGFGLEYVVDVSNYPVERPKWCPTQPDGYDCGIYVIKFMQHIDELGEGFQLQFQSSNERIRLAVEMLISDENVVRRAVLHRLPGVAELFS